MRVEDMTARNLQKWVLKLTRLLNEEKDTHNLKLYRKWYDEAIVEQKAREERKQKYLNGGNKWQQNNT